MDPAPETHSKVLVEGLDLSGKTVVCERLCHIIKPRPELRRATISSSRDLLDFATTQRDAERLSPYALGYLYLSALQDDVDKYVEGNNAVVQESFLGLRLAAYYATRGMSEISNSIIRILHDLGKSVFDKSYILTVGVEERVNRLKQREASTPQSVSADDRLVVSNPKLFLDTEATLVAMATEYFRARLIDTTGLSIDEVAMAIYKDIGQPQPPVS